MAQAKNLTELIQLQAVYYRAALEDDALEMYIEALGDVPFEVVRAAAIEHRKRSKFMPMISELLAIIKERNPIPKVKDPWPTALEAIAMYSKFGHDDSLSGVTFPEMEIAWGQAKELGDPTKFAAQKLFTQLYDDLVAKAKQEGRRPEYRISEGTNKTMLKEVARQAAAAGLITNEQATRHLPYEGVSAELLIETAVKNGSPMSMEFAERLAGFRQQINERAKQYDAKKYGGASASSIFQPVQPGHSVRTGAVVGYGEFKGQEPTERKAA